MPNFSDLKTVRALGPQNMAPVFLSKNVYTYGSASLVGTNHLKMNVHQNDQNYYNCIGFNLGEFLPMINSGDPIDICYTIEENVWKEKRAIQLNIKGIRASLPILNE